MTLRRRSYLAETQKLDRVKVQSVVSVMKRARIPIYWSSKPMRDRPAGRPPKPGARLEATTTLEGSGWMWVRDGVSVSQSKPFVVAVEWVGGTDLRQWKEVIGALVKEGYAVSFPLTRRTVTDSGEVTGEDVKGGTILVVKYR